MEDTRNLVDEYKGLSNEEVCSRMNLKREEMRERAGADLEVAIENVTHDFNIGTIVRNANSFNVAKVHIIGRKKYNRRGAMCTDKYLEICCWGTVAEFLADQKERKREVVAIENNTPRARGLGERRLTVRMRLTERDEVASECETVKGEGVECAGVGETECTDFSGITLVFGSESDGISEELLREADDVRYIESYGSTRSVNVGVASGIAMYKWVQDNLIDEWRDSK